MGTLVWILAVWIGGNALVFLALIWAALPRSAGPRSTPRQRVVGALGGAVLAGTCVATSFVSNEAQWEPAALVVVLATLALAGDLLPVRAASFRVSGSTVAILLALVVLGPAPAVAIGLAGTLLEGVRNHAPRLHVLANLAGYATFPLLGASAFAVTGHGPVAVFAVAVTLSLVNFVMVGGFARLLHGGSLAAMVRRTWLPVLPWEVATAAVVAATTVAVRPFGYGAIAVLAMSLVGLQLMLRALVARSLPSREPVA